MTIEQLAELLNRQPGHVRRMLINRGYLRQNGKPTVFSTGEGLIREDGFIYAKGRNLFIQELVIRDNPTTIEEEIEDVIVEEKDFQSWMKDTSFDFRDCGDYYVELCRRWENNPDDIELQNQCRTKLSALFELRYGRDYDEDEYSDDPIDVFMYIIYEKNTDLGNYFDGLLEQLNEERIEQENTRQYWNDWAAQITNDDGYDSDKFFGD